MRLPGCYYRLRPSHGLRGRGAVDVAELKVKVGKKAEEEVRVEEVEDEEAGCQYFEGGSRRSENARESGLSLLLWTAENKK